MKHNKWVKRFEKEFGTQKQWMSTPPTTPYARRSQLDFYRGLKHFISSLLKEQREQREELIEEVEKLGTLLVARTKEGPELINKEKVLSILEGKKKL